MSHPWLDRDVPRGEDYDERFARLAATGMEMHGEATFVAALGIRSVLDAGCGTGRVAIELARRGIEVAGVDLDPSMLETARAKAPELTWHRADLADLDLGRTFEAVVLAGNVMIFLTPGSEGVVLATMARHLVDDGVLVAGFSLSRAGAPLDSHPLTLADYDAAARAAGLELTERWSTWDRVPYTEGGDYAVSVHRRVTALSPHQGD